MLEYVDDFYDQEENLDGVVCVFSLKNPSYPEYLCSAHCGVLCVDIHPGHPHMLAVGLSDGNVAVYNLQQPTYKPTYISTANNGKHHDIVWQVFFIFALVRYDTIDLAISLHDYLLDYFF